MSITPHRFAHAPSSASSTRFSLGLTRIDRRASSLASDAIVKAAEVSAVLHHPSLCVRRGGCGTSAYTASTKKMVKDSAISDILLGCERSGSSEKIRATTRCLQSPSGLNFSSADRKAGFVFLFARVRWVQHHRSGGPSRARCYGLNPPWLEAEAGGEP